MSLKPPSLWIEKRGHQHRVYWRNSLPGLPARSYLPFYGRAEAEQFVGMAGLLGLDTSRQVLDTDDPQAAAALLQAALAERGLAPGDPVVPQSAPELPQTSAAAPTLFTAPADPRLTGVTFDELWTRFLGKIDDRVVAEVLDLVRAPGPLPIQAVDGHQFVAEQEGGLRPDEHVTDPASVAAVPLRPETADVAVHCPDDAPEGAGLVPHPALTADHGRADRHEDDQIDAEQGEQRDDHGGPPTSVR
jgi:hypothetical protein